MNGDLFKGMPEIVSGQFPVPRPFQDVAHQRLREGLRAGHINQLLVAPTGSGKTFTGLRVIHEAMLKGRRGCFVCDRDALINQTSAVADSYGLSDHGIVQADHWRRNNLAPFQIASIQTIQKRGYWPEADVYVFDEAHTLYTAAKKFLLRREKPVIGLTATPCTKGMGELYDNMVNAATMHELTESGVLVPMDIWQCVKPDMTGAETTGGEWTHKAASEREAEIIGDVIGEWLKLGENRKTIAFGADIAYCEKLVQRFNGAGINAATFTSDTPDNERAVLLKEFEKTDPILRVLVSVEALAKGFDVKDIGCVIDARPLRKSLSTAIQMWGRGLRSAPNKTDCKLLDFSGNFARFHDDFVDVYFNGFTKLDEAEKSDVRIRKEPAEDWAPTGCPQCHRKPFKKRCLACGFEKTSRALEDTNAGVMQQVRLGKKVLATDRHDLWRQLTGYVRGGNSPKAQGYAAHLFRDMTGDWPPREWHIDFTDPSPPTRATLGEIKRRKIAFHRGRNATA